MKHLPLQTYHPIILGSLSTRSPEEIGVPLRLGVPKSPGGFNGRSVVCGMHAPKLIIVADFKDSFSVILTASITFLFSL